MAELVKGDGGAGYRGESPHDTGPDSFGFHWNHGVYFKRMAEGAVRLTIVPNDSNRWVDLFDDDWPYPSFTIPASEWASIVASVSAKGENGETHQAALAFHNCPSHEAQD